MENKTSISTKNMNTYLNNATERIITGKNAGNVTRRVRKKRSYGINKNMTNKNKIKGKHHSRDIPRRSIIWR